MLIIALLHFIGLWVLKLTSRTSNARICNSATNELDQFMMGENNGRQLGMYQLNTSQLPRFTFNGDNRLDFLGDSLTSRHILASLLSFTETSNQDHKMMARRKTSGTV